MAGASRRSRAGSGATDAPRLGPVIPLGRADLDGSELVEGLIDGQPVAVAALYDRFAPLVRRILIRAFGSATDVDDVAQEIFLTVVRRVRGLREPTALRSFVVGVTLRFAKNELRKRTLRRWVGLEIEPAAVADADPTTRDAVRRVYRVLDRLDATSRLVFVLRHVEGLELKELAVASGNSLATVKRKLARAQARFDALATADPVLCEYFERRGDE
jgi:RNA polymerase sigma-70 factor (ECF subfamily)